MVFWPRKRTIFPSVFEKNTRPHVTYSNRFGLSTRKSWNDGYDCMPYGARVVWFMISHSRLARPHKNGKPKFSKFLALRAVSRNTWQLTDPERCCCLHSRWRFKNLLDNIIKHQLTKQNALVCCLEPALLSVYILIWIFHFGPGRKVSGTFEKRAPGKRIWKDAFSVTVFTVALSNHDDDDNSRKQ